MNENLDVNEEIYTDVALQMFTTFINNSGAAELIESFKDSTEDDPAFFPGIIFGCLLHMGNLLGTLSEMTGVEVEEALGYYATTYNLHMREKLVMMPALHPSYAKEMIKQMLNEEGF
jgi:hypothetical protein